MIASEVVAYIAGFFDGEGSASFVWYVRKPGGKKYGKLEAKIAQQDKKVLDWIRRVVGFGRIHGYPERGKRRIVYHFVVQCEQARQFLALIRPYLRVKKTRVDEVIRLDARHCKRRLAT